MAKARRGGLGKGLNSLLGDSSDNTRSPERTQNRDRIVYDEREDITYEIPSDSSQTTQLPGNTDKFGAVGNPRLNNVSRETIVYEQGVSPQEQQVMQQAGVQQSQNIVQDTPATVEERVAETFNTLGDTTNMILEVSVDEIEPNPDQPRTNFKEEDLKELASSIKRDGLIQPILVREINSGTYQIIAGERRWQASKLAGKKTVPIQVKNVSDEKALELALIENIQRTDLNPIEEAYGYKRLMERNKMTQADIAQAVSKGRSTIANALRLLELPEDAQQALFEEKITAGHARAILSIPSKEDRSILTQKLIDNKLSVRETEALARLMANKPDTKAKREPVPPVYKSVARALRASLDTNVKVKSSKGKNKIEIEFKDEKDLERIFDIISPE